MKRFALTSTAFIVAAVLITPKVISIKLESQLNQAVEQVNSVYGYQAEIQNLQSNWFNTQANVKVAINPEEMGIDTAQDELDNFYLNVDIDAAHGLIIPKGEYKVGLVDMSLTIKGDNLREHIDWNAQSPIYQATAFKGLFDGIKFHDEVSPFTFTDLENDLTVEFKGFSGQGSLLGRMVNYTGSSQPLHVNADNTNVTISGIAVDMEADATLTDIFQSNMYDSDTTFKIASIITKDEAGVTNATIDNIVMVAITKMQSEQDTASIVVGYNIDSIEAEGEHIKDVAFDFEMNNISNTFINAYKENQQIFTQGTEAEIQENIVKFAQDNLLEMLKAEPELNITKFNATFNDGSIVSNINTSIKGIEQLPNIVENPMFWVSHLSAKGEVKGDKAIIERFAVNQVISQIKADPNTANMTEEEISSIAEQQAPLLLENLIQQGLIVKTDSGYQAIFNMANSALKVNDVEIPLPL